MKGATDLHHAGTRGVPFLPHKGAFVDLGRGQNSGGAAKGSGEGSVTPLPLAASAASTQPPPIAL